MVLPNHDLLNHDLVDETAKKLAKSIDYRI